MTHIRLCIMCLHSPFLRNQQTLVPSNWALMVHAGKTAQGRNHRGRRDIECLYCEALSHSGPQRIAWCCEFPCGVFMFYKGPWSNFSFRQLSLMHKIVGYLRRASQLFSKLKKSRSHSGFYRLVQALCSQIKAFPDRTGTNLGESIILAHFGQPKKLLQRVCAIYRHPKKDDKGPGRSSLNLYPKWCYLALPAKSFIKRSIQTFIWGVFKRINYKLAYIWGCWRKQSILQYSSWSGLKTANKNH